MLSCNVCPAECNVRADDLYRTAPSSQVGDRDQLIEALRVLRRGDPSWWSTLIGKPAASQETATVPASEKLAWFHIKQFIAGLEQLETKPLNAANVLEANAKTYLS